MVAFQEFEGKFLAQHECRESRNLAPEPSSLKKMLKNGRHELLDRNCARSTNLYLVNLK